MAIADDGISAFAATTTPGDSHNTDSGSSTTLLVNAPPPSLAGSPLVRALSTPALSGGGELFSPVSLLIGSGTPAVTVLNDTLLWSSNIGLVAREGEPAQDQPPGVDYSHLYPRVVANDVSEIAFAGNLSGAGSANAAVWSGSPTALSVVAQKGDVANGTGGETFNSFYAESISPTGTVVIRAGLKFVSGVVTTANNEGLWSDRSGSLELVAREDDLAPCEQPDVRFGRFDAMFLDSSGGIVFFAYLKGLGVNSSNDGSAWRSDADGRLHLIAREGTIANNTDAAVYGQIDVAAANNTGGVLVFARLVSGLGDTTSTNNVGLWKDSGAADATPLLVMRRSDTVTLGGIDRTVNLLGVDYVTNAVGGTGGFGRVLNDSGTAVLTLSLSGNNGGVFTLP
jgi:hypothetical protein